MLNSIRFFILGIAAFVWLMGTLLLVNVVQMSTMIILPFSRKYFRAVNGQIAKYYWLMFVRCLELLKGVKFHFTGDQIPYENAMVLVNHRSHTDILYLLSLARKYNRLQHLKFFAKNNLKYIPALGWGLLFVDCIFLKRDWSKDRKSIEETFRQTLKYRYPVWVVSFVEGTRQTPEKLLASQNYSRKKGAPVFQNLLFPRVKGFVATIQGLQDHLQAIYDVTIGYEQKNPTLKKLISGKSESIHIHVRRFELSELSIDPEALEKWLIKMFETKDALLTQFYKTSRFPVS